MLDERDLQAIVRVLDERLDAKFDEKLKPIHEGLDRIEERLDRVEERLDRVEERLDRVESDITVLKRSSYILENDIAPKVQLLLENRCDLEKMYWLQKILRTELRCWNWT